HLLSKEHLARLLRKPRPEPCPGRMSRGGSSSVDIWLFARVPGKAGPVRPLGGGTAAAAGGWAGTLLGPEGTGVLFPRTVTPRCGCGGVLSRGRPYLENCTVDASINCSRQVDKGARWMPWHQEPMKDVGACD